MLHFSKLFHSLQPTSRRRGSNARFLIRSNIVRRRVLKHVGTRFDMKGTTPKQEIPLVLRFSSVPPRWTPPETLRIASCLLDKNNQHAESWPNACDLILCRHLLDSLQIARAKVLVAHPLLAEKLRRLLGRSGLLSGEASTREFSSLLRTHGLTLMLEVPVVFVPVCLRLVSRLLPLTLTPDAVYLLHNFCMATCMMLSMVVVKCKQP